ncbi:MAG TPA: phosphoenolpyruvate carboxykinase (ATP), partial [Candidatus Dormibacteraeota bacterium]
MTDVIRASGTSLPAAKSIRWNPSPEELRQLTASMPNAHPTIFGNYNVETRVVARSKASTYVVTDHPERHSDQTIGRAEGERIAAMQDAHIAGRDMLVIDGYIGNEPDHRVAARLYIEAANANIAGMQQALYFGAEDAGPDFQPRLTVIYTPNL